jgi:transposase
MELVRMLEGCRDDEPDAWEAFLRYFSQASGVVLSSFFSLSSLDREEAADTARFKIVAEIRADRVKAVHAGEFVNFVRVTVKRCALDLLRARPPRDEVSQELPDRSPGPFNVVASRSRLDCIEKVLDAWAEDERIARELDLGESVLRNWIRQAEIDAGRGRPGALTTDERAELTRLRQDVRTLRLEREILKKATAFFAKENA